MTPTRLYSRLTIALFLGLALCGADAQAGLITSSVLGEGVTAGYSSMSIDFYSGEEDEAEQFRPGAGFQVVIRDGADQPGSGGILSPARCLWQAALGGLISLADERCREISFSIESPPS